jgi:hypothetical protein
MSYEKHADKVLINDQLEKAKSEALVMVGEFLAG